MRGSRNVIIWIAVVTSLCCAVIDGRVIDSVRNPVRKPVEGIGGFDAQGQDRGDLEDSTTIAADDSSENEIAPLTEKVEDSIGNQIRARTDYEEDAREGRPTTTTEAERDSPEITTEYKYTDLLKPYIIKGDKPLEKPIVGQVDAPTIGDRSTPAPPKTNSVWDPIDPLVDGSYKPSVRPIVEYRPVAVHTQSSFRTSTTTDRTEDLETTTKYKYIDLIQPYTIKYDKPLSVPIRHAAGTYWMRVDQSRPVVDQLLETQRNVFDRQFSSEPRPVNVPPPKY